MKIIIGISGKLGSGKDYMTNNVIIPVLEQYAHKSKDNAKYLQCAFADQIKVNVMVKNNVLYSDVYESKTAESRLLLQKEGTDARKLDNPNIWVDYLANWINVYYNRNITTFVISDVRYKNEYNFIKNNDNDTIGLMIKVVAPTRNENRLTRESNGNDFIYNKIKSHPSECDLDDLPDEHFDLIIHNDPEDKPAIAELQLQFSKLFYQSQFNK